VKKSKRIVSLLLVFLLAIGMTFATGCSKKDASTGALVVTVGDNKIYMNEMMYYIYDAEAQGASYEAMAQQYYGTSYWDIPVSEGVTMRDKTKGSLIDNAIQIEILYEKAVDAGKTLTEKEITANKTSIKSALKSFTKEQLKLTGFTEKSLLKTINKLTLAGKYNTELVDGFDIDDKAITDGISIEDNRQYNTEYLFIPTTTYDASYKAVAKTDEEKKAALNSITAALEKVKAGEEFSAITKADTTITTSTLNFVYGDKKAESAYQEAAITLKNDAYTTDIVETESGYFIVKMVDNNSTESYDKAVADAISAAEQEAFTTEYDKMKKDYTTTINTKFWDTVILGQTTIVATTNASTTDAATTDAATTDAATTDAAATTDTTTTEE